MNIELLAPAGSYESMTAAYEAGADAVYIGGTKFGARAYADNLEEEQMKRAIDYAHLHDKKLFLTVNTLLKDSELDVLYEYLNPYYQEGLDAVIVQDLGVFSYIREQFPHMDIHASTQMTVTGHESAAYLKEAGASRVVTAREMNLSEIRAIHDRVDIEIETFVHGALCFCYSGQCLLSSLIGGRSGNRGRCAQPCRLPYELYQEETRISRTDSPYLCSPKDMCTLSLIPQLCEAGIYSFKMEGRMKKPEYTAGITGIYRKYLDCYLEKGAKNYVVSETDMQILMDLYNRGGFSQGYLKKHNGKDMMTLDRPNHQGTKGVRILVPGLAAKCTALEDLNKKDVLELPGRKEVLNVTLDQPYHKGQSFTLRLPKDAIQKKDQILYRTRNQLLIDSLTDQYINRISKVKINGNLILSVGKSAMITVSSRGCSVTVTGEEVQSAQNRPMTRSDVERQIRKTGQTSMAFEDLQIRMDDNLFLPMQALNELRRNALEKLEEALIRKYQRESSKKVPIPEAVFPAEERILATASVETQEQFFAVAEQEGITRIYVSSNLFSEKQKAEETAVRLIEKGHAAHKQVYYQSPLIHRQEKIAAGLLSLELLQKFDGILCRSLETFAYLKRHAYEKPILADSNLYSFNRAAREFLSKEGFSGDTVPVEMNYRELENRGCQGSEMILYGYLPLMVSAQCFKKNTLGCDQKPGLFYLKDRKGIRFPVRNLCRDCFNIVYNSSPLELCDRMQEIHRLQLSSLRLSFTIEDAEETSEVLRTCLAAINGEHSIKPVHQNFTRGHFKRGVE